jgi:cytochrome c551/c552
MRLRPVIVLTAVLALAGCGGEKTVSPKPETVVGSVPTQSAPATTSTTSGGGGQTTTSGGGGGAADGKALFASNGCVSCHTYKPAGSKATVGPDLDKLATYAKQAKQPLAPFVHDSIVDPNKFVGKQCPPSGTAQCPKNVMPKSYKSLPAQDLKDLVDFLTKPQG